MLTTTINYNTDTGKRQFINAYDPSKNQGVDGRDGTVPVMKDVVDARGLDRRPTLSQHGFELRTQNIAPLSAADFDDDRTVRGTYYPLVSEVISAATGAAKVIPFHHAVRSADPTSAAKKPASVAHCDYTTRNALDLFDKIAPVEFARGRFAIVNAWHNIGADPIEDNHLAMCDATSIVAPDDFTVYDVFQEPGKPPAETFRLDSGHHTRHRWYYYPRKVRDECLLFLQYDSDTTRPVRFTFHSAISDPNAPRPPRVHRRSIEVRALCLFPDHPTNTLPTTVKSAANRVDSMINSVMGSLPHADHWDAHGKNWMRGELSAPGGVDRAIAGLINHHNGKASAKLTAAEIAEVHKQCKARNFETIARHHFNVPAGPVSSSRLPASSGGGAGIDDAKVEAIVQAVLGSLPYADHWDQGGKDWMRRELPLSGGVDRVIAGLVGHHDGKATVKLNPAETHEAQKRCRELGFEATARQHFPKS